MPANPAIAPPSLADAELVRAPWMKAALGELGKREISGGAVFQREQSLALAQNMPHYSLLDWKQVNKYFTRRLDDADKTQLEATVAANTDVSKYLRSTNLKDLTKVSKEDHGPPERRMQAWCAAFVNWSLIQAGIKPLGSASAAAWLKFGQPVQHPERGTIVVFHPTGHSATSGYSGHVAFFGGWEGSYVWVLGGNQHREVCWRKYPTKLVVKTGGYRWPSTIGPTPWARFG